MCEVKGDLRVPLIALMAINQRMFLIFFQCCFVGLGSASRVVEQNVSCIYRHKARSSNFVNFKLSATSELVYVDKFNANIFNAANKLLTCSGAPINSVPISAMVLFAQSL